MGRPNWVKTAEFGREIIMTG
eukprot:COSAG01_NODE_66939_length_268_cov_1.195266_1_plen_20_part_10